MVLSEFERESIEKLFGEYCHGKVPPHVRNMLQIEYTIRGSEVKLFECRPRYDDHSVWTELPVARFKEDEKKNEKKNTWLLYCADRNSKWHLLNPMPKTKF